MNREMIIPFSKTSVLVCDSEREVTELFRALCIVNGTRLVEINIQSDQSRAGNAPLWMDDRLSRSEIVQLVDQIEQSLKNEADTHARNVADDFKQFGYREAM
jgi:hypothetical protein